MASSVAAAQGKNLSFAHQVGVLRAVSAVLSNGVIASKHDERQLQFETVPFNRLSPAVGRAAIAEYLVWKFFPAHAREEFFAPSLLHFRDKVVADAEQEQDPSAFLYNMLHGMNTDWQRWIDQNRSQPAH